ncbi:hypothetical protein TEK04_20970 [Klenkia sp. LSe6-5]|uniref:Uncharacterized protein n=1 Tax=Klenkia sesuvii TaxID=3103137 RepID=A0ABU8DZE7_9ACTN
MAPRARSVAGDLYGDYLADAGYRAPATATTATMSATSAARS